MCTFVRNICQSRRLRFKSLLEKTPHTRHTRRAMRKTLPTPGPGARGAARPGGAGPRGAGHRGRPGPPQRPRQMPRGCRGTARAEPRLDFWNGTSPHTTRRSGSQYSAHIHSVSRTDELRAAVMYGLTSTSKTGDHRNILAHSNKGAPLPQTPPPIVSSAASSRPRLWVAVGGDGMNARRGRMRAGLLRRGAGQGRGRMSAWRLAGRQMGFCRLPPKSPRCGSVSERY